MHNILFLLLNLLILFTIESINNTQLNPKLRALHGVAL